MKKKIIKESKLLKSGIDVSIIVTILLKLGTYLTVLNGRKTLRILSILRLGKLSPL